MKRLYRTVFGAIVLGAMLMARGTATRATSEQYTVTDLGTLGGNVSEATALNNVGEVAGWSVTASGATHPFLWTNGSLVDLGNLPGYDNCRATGVNDAGTVVGRCSGGSPGTKGFMWSAGILTDLGHLFDAPGQPGTGAAAINNAGQITGFATGNIPCPGSTADVTRAFRTISDAPIDTATDNVGPIRDAFITGCAGIRNIYRGVGLAINDLGQVAGTMNLGSFTFHPFVTTPGGEIDAGSDLAVVFGQPVLGGSANGINDHGDVVGEIRMLSPVTGLSTSHAFLFKDGVVTDIGLALDTPPDGGASFAFDINNVGQVVGSGEPGSFIYDTVNGFRFLSSLLSPDWNPRVFAINDLGQLAGSGSVFGSAHALRLDPVGSGSGDTPVGEAVPVSPVDATTGSSPVTVTFSSVSQSGETSLITSANGEPLPSGYSLGDPPVYYEISTTATYVPPISVCINYAGVSYSDEDQLHILHLESGAWVDRTTSLDTNADVICATVDSLSPFVVAERRIDLTALSPAAVWLGLKNSDDVGTKFDLLAEVLVDGDVIGTGQALSVPGGSSGFNNALLRTVPLELSSPVALSPGAELSIRLSVRIAATGHRRGTARLWFNDPAANSRFGATLDAVTTAFYLIDRGPGLELAQATATGPRRSVDVTVDRAVGGNPYKPFGTWTIPIQ